MTLAKLVLPAVFLWVVTVAQPNREDSWERHRYTWTGTWSTMTDCSPYCPDTGEPYEWCVYDAYKLVITGKQCKCHCEFNQRYVPCMKELRVTGTSGCDGWSFYLTDEVRNDNEVYRAEKSGNARVLYWSGSEWRCENPADGYVWSKCDKRAVTECSSGIKAECKGSYYRNDVKCGMSVGGDGFPEQRAICNADGQYPCCEFNGGWCGKETGHCTGTNGINFGHVKGPCLFWDVYMATKNIDFCNITPLDEVSNEIGKQRFWNLAGAILGNIPEVGHLFDMWFAMMDPVSPITSPFALANNIITAVNEQIDSLQNCMYAQLAGLYVATLENDFGAIFQKMGACYEAVGDEKEFCVKEVYYDLYGQLDSLSRPPPGDQKFISYFEMLPLYQSIYQTWMVVAAGRLGDLKYLNDGCNFNNVLNSVRYGSQQVLNWVQNLALPSIVGEMSPPEGWNDDSSCTYEDKDGTRKFYSGDTSKLYATVDKGGCSHRFRQALQVSVKMTNERENWCHFIVDMDSKQWCEDDWPGSCTKARDGAKRFVDMVQHSLNNYFIPAYVEKFVVAFENFTKNLDEIPSMECDSSTTSLDQEFSKFTGESASRWTSPAMKPPAQAFNKHLVQGKQSPVFSETYLPQNATKSALAKQQDEHEKTEL